MRPPSSQWIPTTQTSSYSTPASVSIPLQLFLGSPLTALFPFLNKFFPRLKALCCISACSWGRSKEFLSILYKAFLRPLLTYASAGWLPFLSVINITKLKRLYRAATRTISGCLLSSPIPIPLSEASLSPLRVTLTRFTLLFYERALRLPISFPMMWLSLTLTLSYFTI